MSRAVLYASQSPRSQGVTSSRYVLSRLFSSLTMLSRRPSGVSLASRSSTSTPTVFSAGASFASAALVSTPPSAGAVASAATLAAAASSAGPSISSTLARASSSLPLERFTKC